MNKRATKLVREYFEKSLPERQGNFSGRKISKRMFLRLSAKERRQVRLDFMAGEPL